MSTIKRYIVEHDWNSNCSVSLEVDHGLLTKERADEINSFWGDDKYRENRAGGVVPAVIRLFAQRTINQMLAEGGADFSATNTEAADIWSRQMRAEEGWGGEEDPAEPLDDAQKRFGWCGIRIVAAEVSTVYFSDLELREIKI